MKDNTTICPCCKGNGFTYLSFNPIVTEPCDECKMTGEKIYTDYTSINSKGFSDDKQTRC